MIGILVLTQGNLAPELLATARVIAGALEGFSALTLGWDEDFEEARSRVHRALEELEQGEGVLVLTDLYGSTPFNVAISFAQPGRVEIVSGVNLPMVVRLGCLEDDSMSVQELARWIRAKGQRSICRVGETAETGSERG